MTVRATSAVKDVSKGVETEAVAPRTVAGTTKTTATAKVAAPADLLEAAKAAPARAPIKAVASSSVPDVPSASLASGYTPKAGDIAIRGKIVTMDDAGTVQNGMVLVSNGVIGGIVPPGYSLPAGVKVVDTKGAIYPGLMNLHDHLAYNFLPVLPVDKQWGDRNQWPSGKEYEEYVNNPKNMVTDAALYGEGLNEYAYALIQQVMGGTTAAQGAPPGAANTGLVRNIEAKNADISPTDSVGANVIGYGKSTKGAALTAAQATFAKEKAEFIHLAEGVDAAAQAEYGTYKGLGLVTPSLVGIHSTGLNDADFADWLQTTKEGPKVVWSPTSNLMLYGGTTDVLAARKHNGTVALGTDWNPSGNKNLLWELKTANEVSKQLLGGALSPQDLVEMVTKNPAKLLQWEDKVGQIKPGMVADLMVVDDAGGDPYMNLINSVESNVQLVVTAGNPVYGDAQHMETLGVGSTQPITDFHQRPKALDLSSVKLQPGTQSVSDLMQSLDAAEKFSPSALAQQLNSESTGPTPFKDREAIKAWLVADYGKTKTPVPAGFTDKTAPITEPQVADYLARKYPNAQPLPGVIPLSQEMDATFVKAVVSNPNIAKALPGISDALLPYLGTGASTQNESPGPAAAGN